MTLPARVEPIVPLIETLVSCRDPLLRDRVLVEAALMCLRARGIALWRPTRERNGDVVWRPVLTHGRSVGLPSASEVRAVVDGAFEGQLGSERRVLSCADGAHPWALAVSGAVDEDGLMLVETLFALALQLDPEAVEPGCHDPADSIQPPLPRAPESPTTSLESDELRHDLRNLLTTLRSAYDYVDRFGDELDEDETRDVDEVVARDLSRVGRLFARALDAAAEPDATWSPTRLVRDVLASFRPEFQAAGLTLQATQLEVVDAPRGLDEVDAWRIVENLVRNALEALRASGATDAGVRLSWTRSRCGNATVLRIEDDGPGLPEPTAQLFEPGVTHGKPTGSGLGLSSVRDLVARSGGSVEATLRPRGGACFAVRWPIHSGPDDARHA